MKNKIREGEGTIRRLLHPWGTLWGEEKAGELLSKAGFFSPFNLWLGSGERTGPGNGSGERSGFRRNELWWNKSLGKAGQQGGPKRNLKSARVLC